MNNAHAEYEQRDVYWNAVWRWSAGLLVLLAATAVLMIGWFHVLRGRYAHIPGDGQPPAAQEVVQQLQSSRESEDQTLNTYGWVSQQDGIARIPIARAMQWLVEEHAATTDAQPAEGVP